jgi:hypothetical protein
MGEDVGDLGHFGKYDRFPQHLTLCPVSEREAAAQGNQHDAGENRPACRRQQQTSGKQGWKNVQEKRRGSNRSSVSDMPWEQPCGECKRATYRNMQRFAHAAQAEWIRKR